MSRPLKGVLVVSPDPNDAARGGVEKFCHMLADALMSQGIFARVVNQDEGRAAKGYLLVTNGTLGTRFRGPRVHVYHGCAAVQVPISHPEASRNWRARHFVANVRKEILSGIGATRVAVSASCAREVRSCYALSSVVIPNAVDTQLFAGRPRDEVRRQLQWGLDWRIALFVGRGEARKRPDIALQTAQELGYEIVHAGSRPADGMESLGSLDQAQLALAMSAADVIYLPSVYEANSLALLESIATGTPTVTTITGYVRDILSGVPEFSRLCAHPGDPRSFLEAGRVVAEYPDLTADIMRSTSAFVRRAASTDKFVNNWCSLVRRLINQGA